MSRQLLSAGAIWIDEDFVPDSLALYANVVSSITWDERMRARKAASFGLAYNYSGIVWPELPFPEILESVRECVSQRLGYVVNNCLAHYYPDGNSTMGFHADATENLMPETGIVIVSLGAERAITFRKDAEKRSVEEYRLMSGSLFYMCPEMQLTWKHAILAAKGVNGGRISLTFRCINPVVSEAFSSGMVRN